MALAMTAVATLVATATPLPAQASQLANERAEAAGLAARIAQLGNREAALGEQYDAGVAALSTAKSRVAAASTSLARAQASQVRTVALLRADAVQAYVSGGANALSPNTVPTGNLDNALFSQELEQTFASQQTNALDEYRLAADQDVLARARLVAARDADARRLGQLAKDRREVEVAQAQLVSLQSQVKGQIATLVAEIQRQQILAEQRAEQARLAAEAAAQAAAQARAAAAAQAAAAARAAANAAQARQAQLAAAQRQSQLAEAATTTTQVPAANPSPPPAPQIPGVSPAAATAVAAAESRVGDPYVWGGAGPDDFDCSGLVMWSYAQAGIYLPHYSGAQYDDTTHIPMSDLEPGDLVFPANPGEHVAMYIGNGEIVQAPYTGADVQIVPLTSFFVLASRVS